MATYQPTHPVQNVPSTAAIAGLPIHALLVPFPIAFLVGTLLSDIGFWWTEDRFWAYGALWLLGASVVSAILAAFFGLIDFMTLAQVRAYRASWLHMLGSLAVMGLALLNLVLRLIAPVDAVLPGGLIISGLTTGLLLIAGWYGWELVYNRMVGVTPRGEPVSELHPGD